MRCRFCGVPPFRSKDEENLYELIKKGDLDFTSSDVWEEVSDEGNVELLRERWHLWVVIKYPGILYKFGYKKCRKPQNLNQNLQ
ncbi:hypothetical protein DPMN_052668 [Dreissena polymorpha]|uniref:Uncharacterized protein n=1 Tax=Dreissena polymorpha TaxID=45954 RepID=A0A9D4CK30_DREPO|nr:hypothetical protein DPMN_052668 [Dreissena polymorpha]